MYPASPGWPRFLSTRASAGTTAHLIPIRAASLSAPLFRSTQPAAQKPGRVISPCGESVSSPISVTRTIWPTGPITSARRWKWDAGGNSCAASLARAPRMSSCRSAALRGNEPRGAYVSHVLCCASRATRVSAIRLDCRRGLCRRPSPRSHVE